MGSGDLVVAMLSIASTAGGGAIPDQDPNRVFQTGTDEGLEGRDHWTPMVTCLIEEMKKCTIKPVNYDKIKEVTQEKDENPALLGAMHWSFMKVHQHRPCGGCGTSGDALFPAGSSRHQEKITKANNLGTPNSSLNDW